jgi:hypothetical protein
MKGNPGRVRVPEPGVPVRCEEIRSGHRNESSGRRPGYGPVLGTVPPPEMEVSFPGRSGLRDETGPVREGVGPRSRRTTLRTFEPQGEIQQHACCEDGPRIQPREGTETRNLRKRNADQLTGHSAWKQAPGMVPEEPTGERRSHLTGWVPAHRMTAPPPLSSPDGLRTERRLPAARKDRKGRLSGLRTRGKPGNLCYGVRLRPEPADSSETEGKRRSLRRRDRMVERNLRVLLGEGYSGIPRISTTSRSNQRCEQRRCRWPLDTGPESRIGWTDGSISLSGLETDRSRRGLRA